MHEIIQELNLENGSKYKISVLKKYEDNLLLKRLLKMTYDKVVFSYGITMKNIGDFSPVPSSVPLTLDFALASLESNFSTGDVTGHAASQMLVNILHGLSAEDRTIIEGVIDRTQGINLGRTNINKVFKNLIVKPPYQRCDIGTEKNIKKNMDFEKGVLSQVKMDGTYRSCTIDGKVNFTSRPGNDDVFPLLEQDLRITLKHFTLIGELTVKGVSDRAEANGLINSDNPPHDDIIYTVWDMIPSTEYGMKNGTSDYKDRFAELKQYVSSLGSERIQVVEHKEVYTMKEAYEHFQEVTKRGLEGTVIKAHDMKWKDGTSKQQLKVKLIIQLDMRITGFNEGNRGSRHEAYFSGINFQNDEGTIRGTIGVTTMPDKIRDWFHENRDNLIGQVMEVECNDLTQASKNDYFALSHPRYNELRDKDDTDTLVRAFLLKEMAMEIGEN